MRLLRFSDVETSPNDRVFRYSRTRAVVLVLLVLGLTGWLVFYALTSGWKLGYYIAAIIVLFFELMRGLITARFRPSNWLVRMKHEGVFIQFRSYLNYHLPPEDLTVLFVAYQEIRSARLVRERIAVPDNQGGTSTQTLRSIELELVGDTGALAKALAAESAERAPREKRWYGYSSTLYEDHPVRMPSPPFLQVRWQVVPRAQKFLGALCPYTSIVEPVLISQDFVHLQGLSREEQQRRLRDLAQRGETIAAVYMVRKLYGCGLSEAKEMVEGLKNQSSAGQ